MCCLHRFVVSEANFDVLLHLGKLVTLRDFTNIVTNLWLETESHGKDLQAVISKPGRIHVLLLMGSLTRSTTSWAFFTRIKQLKDTFQAFPEMLFNTTHVEFIKDATLCISNL